VNQQESLSPTRCQATVYAAVSCLFFASPTARRTMDAAGSGTADVIAAGTRRGNLSGLAEFATCMVRALLDGRGFEVALQHPQAIHLYRNGTELLELLRQVVAAEPARTPSETDLFGPEERIVVRELRRLQNLGGTGFE
jgi:hypothetical protein